MGGDCILNNFYTATVTLTPGPGSSSWYKKQDTSNTQLGYALVNSQQILAFVASKAGVDKSKCRFKNMTFGSIQATIVVELAKGVNPRTALHTLQTSKYSSSDDFGIANVVGTVNNAGSDDGQNLGLVLGLIISLTILAIIILAFIIYRFKNKGQEGEKVQTYTHKELCH